MRVELIMSREEINLPNVLDLINSNEGKNKQCEKNLQLKNGKDCIILPLYCPHLNPIENMLPTLKNG